MKKILLFYIFIFIIFVNQILSISTLRENTLVFDGGITIEDTLDENLSGLDSNICYQLSDFEELCETTYSDYIESNSYLLGTINITAEALDTGGSAILKMIVGGLDADNKILTTTNATHDGFEVSNFETEDVASINNLQSAVQFGVGLYEDSLWIAYDEDSGSMAINGYERQTITNEPIGGIPIGISNVDNVDIFIGANDSSNVMIDEHGICIGGQDCPSSSEKGLSIGSNIYVSDVHGTSFLSNIQTEKIEIDASINPTSGITVALMRTDVQDTYQAATTTFNKVTQMNMTNTLMGIDSFKEYKVSIIATLKISSMDVIETTGLETNNHLISYLFMTSEQADTCFNISGSSSNLSTALASQYFQNNSNAALAISNTNFIYFKEVANYVNLPPQTFILYDSDMSGYSGTPEYIYINLCLAIQSNTLISSALDLYDGEDFNIKISQLSAELTLYSILTNR